MQEEIQTSKAARARRVSDQHRFRQCAIHQHVGDVACGLHQKQTQVLGNQAQKHSNCQRIGKDDWQQGWSGTEFHGGEQTIQLHRSPFEARSAQV